MLLVELVMLLVDEATTWLPTLQFELLLVSACKFCNFESFLDNACGGGGGGDEELPDSGHSPCSHSNGSLVACHFQSSNIHVFSQLISVTMLLNPDCVGRKGKLLL